MPTNEYVYDTYRKLSQEDTNAINNALQSGKLVRSIQGKGTYVNGKKMQNTADDYMKTIVGDNNYSFYNGVLHSNVDVSNVEGAIQVTPEYIKEVEAGTKIAPNPTGSAVTTGDNRMETPAKTTKPISTSSPQNSYVYNATNPYTSASAAANASSSANAYSSGGSNTYSSAVPTGGTVYSAYTGAGNANAYGGVDYNAQVSKTISDLEAQYRSLYDRYAGGDFTKTPYYQTIMDQYGIKGDDASNAEKASGAANNGGNLDSYAAANARRQQLAYRNAAQTAALEAYNSEYNNLLNNLHSLGVDVNNLYSTWGTDLDSQRDYASSLAGYDTQRYMSDNDLRGTMYTSDNTLAGTKYTSDNSLSGVLAEAAARENVAKTQADADKYSALQDYLGKLYGYDTQRDVAKTEAEATIRKQELANAISKYTADINAEIAKGNNASAEKIQRLKNEQAAAEAELNAAVEREKLSAQQTSGNPLGVSDTTWDDILYILQNGGTLPGVEDTTPESVGAVAPPITQSEEDIVSRYGIDTMKGNEYYVQTALDLYRAQGSGANGNAEYVQYLNSLAQNGVPSADINYIDEEVKRRAFNDIDNVGTQPLHTIPDNTSVGSAAETPQNTVGTEQGGARQNAAPNTDELIRRGVEAYRQGDAVGANGNTAYVDFLNYLLMLGLTNEEIRNIDREVLRLEGRPVGGGGRGANYVKD